LAVTTAWAGEIRLYERPDFRGPSLVTSSPLDTVARQGLGDSASSIVVADGRWEVCTMEYFRGRCTELQPGSYPSLSVSLNGRIASVREIGYSQPVPVTVAPSPPVVVAEPPPYPFTRASRAHDGRPRLLVRESELWRRWVTMDRGEANDLDWAHFQNPTHRATSVRVESGNWLFCTDMAFQGSCRIFGPGEYANLGGDMARASHRPGPSRHRHRNLEQPPGIAVIEAATSKR
jgi:hypothetical protein